MYLRVVHVIVFLLVLVGAGRAQVATEPCQSAVPTGNNTFSQPANASNGTGDGDAISWRAMPSNIWHDQKNVYWDCPRHMFRTGQWIPAAAFLGLTAALIGTDQYVSPHFSGTTNFHGFDNVLSGTNTTIIIAAVPTATYLTGLITKNAYAQRTALWTGEAIADSEIAVEVLKLATRRLRPDAGAPYGNFANTWLDSPTVSDGGFPSGHTVAAFSVATVMSRRYGRNHRWVPFVAYGAATAIGFSRVTLSAHNVSDVFVGATIGYAISRFIVLGRYSPN
ncbi:MAG TPA: phosphatase PAP2 family protein [Bryobacteraceae bacterium]|jgi:membrane-associated phospholipid phosphatase|nr:phosphatase PAP2 family protein [Bryobacteraceae bacterium]